MRRTLLTRRHPKAEEYARAMNRSRLGSGKDFAELLNQQTPAAKRIREMFLALREALTVAQDAGRRDCFGVGDRERALFDFLMERFNEQAGRYTGAMIWTGMFWPQNETALQRIRKEKGGLYLTEDEKERFVFLPPEPITSFQKVADDVPAEEWNGFLSLLQLMREKQIGRLRGCEHCGKWMWLRVPAGGRCQRFCSPACASDWRKSSEYQDHQADYMREYRKKEKEKVLAALEAAKSKHRRRA